jgi:hypothetical protein
VHFQDFGGGVELALLNFAALGLDLAELSQRAFELASEALPCRKALRGERCNFRIARGWGARRSSCLQIVEAKQKK